MKSNLNRLSLLGSVLCVFTLNTALAGDVSNHKTDEGNVSVAIYNLNLSRPAGLAKLQRRVEMAAREVCGVGNMKVSLDVERKNRECVAATIDNTYGKIDGVKLTAL